MIVSIIIPTFNRGHLIGETLQSVINQTCENWECIVVDDGSDDNTKQVVQEFVKRDNRFRYLDRPLTRTKGANACRNFGYEKSKGELINWLDSDDILDGAHFLTHINLHKKHEDAQMTVTKAAGFEGSINNILGNWSNIKPDTLYPYKEMIDGKISWATPSVVWKKGALPSLPWNEKLWSSQEWTFHVLQLYKDLQYIIKDTVTIYVRRHEIRVGKSSNSKKYKSGFLSRYLVYKQLKRDGNLTEHLSYHLLRIMLKNVSHTIRRKYDKTLIFQIKCLFTLFDFGTYNLSLLRILFISIPIYRITGKGEKLLLINKNTTNAS